MNRIQTVITGACLLGAVGLTGAGLYWLMLRSAYRKVMRDLLDDELDAILADTEECDDDDGVKVTA